MGRKRNYVDAGFEGALGADTADTASVPENSPETNTETPQQPPKKKRIRKSAKKYKKAAQHEAEGKREDTADNDGDKTGDKSGIPSNSNKSSATGANATTPQPSQPSQPSEKKAAKLEKTAAIKKHKSNKRREDRIAQRQSDTLCYGCRQKGHSVDRCPQNDGKKQSTLCYRCGSTTHSLKLCRKPKPKDGVELPYASCFICNNKGHLAGQCERNQRGVYPRGGECKICKSVEHLAKDCPVRSDQEKEARRPPLIVGTGETGGNADEDDFHVLTARKTDIEMKEKAIKSGKGGLATPKQPNKKVVGF
ncbi:hypothetical protein E3P92_02764 [Wallemia ichthyophaga]|uniref:CCHC-type domain-containing protein n=1 Tax=Wallemia ichthyophaga TaxID=245174 RepID=A0A4T0FQ56_WALIC|nr:hypothetical protein E3P91_02717 [Wallemia ichthyophaga]TIA89704.1 hypothetical protein E3P97_02889 [Wallemia ichthyophaga]TIA98360.1 hypothetical protein E3P95_02479 [Wallemia ichthyophaga]TIA99505.1 hypothetical protein E3P94_02540 [Wallemia ichthyophaga]TIB06369.1 hypothetical protein E3P96_00508 [Wallemia ichthyophaga]